MKVWREPACATLVYMTTRAPKANTASRTVMGIDPGTATMGWGLVRAAGPSASRISYVQHGAIRTGPKEENSLRLERIHDSLAGLLAAYRPEAVAIEQLFFGANVTSAISVGQARGVAVLAARKAGAEVHDYTPLQIKQAITSYGRAEKSQVQRMVKTLLSLREIPTPDDAADALAAAICHCFSAPAPSRNAPGPPTRLDERRVSKNKASANTDARPSRPGKRPGGAT